MSRSRPAQLAAQSLLRSPRAPASPRCAFLSQPSRRLSQTTSRLAESDSNRDGNQGSVAPRRRASESLLESIYGSSAPSSQQQKQQQQQQQQQQQAPSSAMANLSQSAVFQTLDRGGGSRRVDTSVLGGRAALRPAAPKNDDDYEPYHFHVFSHKHNTHITVTRPSRDPIVSMSCGNIGYRKSRRGTFDSAYSLAKYVLERLNHMGWSVKINRLGLVLRGFGQGRDAAVKVLMSPEGQNFRDKIVRVSDATRVKFAGTRSKKKRRV